MPLMNDAALARRLARELPRWQSEGWISPAGAEAVLADLAARQPKTAWASALALAGALLLGIGVITWFAAHWVEMGKLAKLLLIFGALGISHAAHGFFAGSGNAPRLAQGMALLSVLFFGAAIMLIGQIYHIDAHFPDGIALWAAGGLATAWLLRSQPALLAAAILAAHWTWFEQFEFGRLNLPLLAFLALALRPTLLGRWRLAARALVLLTILWSAGLHGWRWHGEGWLEHEHFRLLAIQLSLAGGLWALAQGARHWFARSVRDDLLLVCLLGTFAFTFPRFAPSAEAIASTLAPAWWGALVLAGAFYGYGIWRLAATSELPARQRKLGVALAGGVLALLFFEMRLVPGERAALAVVWNLLFLPMLFWLGDLGVRRGDRRLVNRAFFGFAALLTARYFDTFWTLLDRSLFFMAGGALLLIAGWWIEQRRRGLLAQIASRETRL
jgi:uncharacterized membrane protein